jgi:putative spermidine/putrescine transport system permease protein
MYRAVDAGLRAVDIRTLTEAAQSLGANWLTIIKDVILPNMRVSLLSGMFLTFAIVMGEFTFASLLSWPAFGPYIEEIGSMRAYTPQAVSIMSFAITWLSIAAIQWVGSGGRGQVQVGGAR